MGRKDKAWCPPRAPRLTTAPWTGGGSIRQLVYAVFTQRISSRKDGRFPVIRIPMR